MHWSSTLLTRKCRLFLPCRIFESSSNSAGHSSSDESDSDNGGSPREGHGNIQDKEAMKAARKLHKKEVKEANKERRKHKIPKSVKKRQTSKNKKKK